MKFNEAMDKLKEGAKVTRNPWREGVYFLIQEGDVKSFQPKITQYIYNEDIMVSEGWLVDKDDTEYKFSDIIPFLQKGHKAKLKEWSDSFIYLDYSTKSLVLHSMDTFPFALNFDAFTAEDWMVIE